MWYIVAALFAIPVVAALLPALTGPGSSMPEIYGIVVFTLKEAFVSALITTLVSIPGAYALYRRPSRASLLLRNVVMVPFVLPGILVVLSMVIFYGRSGVLSTLYMNVTGSTDGFTFLYGFWGIVLVHVFYNISLGIKIIGNSWAHLDSRILEAAEVLGSSSMRTFIKVILPLLFPSIMYGFLLVFLYSALSFTVVLIFGGGILKTMEVAIYHQVNNKLDFSGASLIALVQTALLSICVFINWMVTVRKRKISSAFSGIEYRRKRSGERLNIFSKIYLCLLGLFSFGPLAALFVRSLQPSYQGGPRYPGYISVFSGEALGSLGVSAISIAYTSLLIAVPVTMISCVTAYLVCNTRHSNRSASAAQDLFALLPLTVSPLTFGLGVDRLLPETNNAAAGIIAYQVFMAFPVVYSIMRIGVDQYNVKYSEAASTLGAGVFRSFVSVKFPLLKSTLISSFAYGLAISLGDFSGVLLLGKGDVITISIAIYRLIGHYNFQQATAVGAILGIITTLLFALTEFASTTMVPGGSDASTKGHI